MFTKGLLCGTGTWHKKKGAYSDENAGISNTLFFPGKEEAMRAEVPPSPHQKKKEPPL